MNRFLWSLVTLLPLLFWEKLSPFLFGSAVPSEATASRSHMARGVAQWAGGADVSETAVAVITLFAVFFSAAFGLVTHLMLGDKGLGAKLNGLVGTIGAGAIAAAWFLLVPKSAFSYSAVLFASIVGATTLLAAACALKSVGLSSLDDYMTGASRPARSAASGRIAAVTRRR